MKTKNDLTALAAAAKEILVTAWSKHLKQIGAETIIDLDPEIRVSDVGLVIRCHSAGGVHAAIKPARETLRAACGPDDYAESAHDAAGKMCVYLGTAQVRRRRDLFASVGLDWPEIDAGPKVGRVDYSSQLDRQ